MMRQIFSKFFLYLFIFIPVLLSAQFKPAEDSKPLPKPDFYKWKFGFGINIVDDKGTRFKDLFKTKENWNALPYPSRISVERHLEEHFSCGLVGTINKYKEGKNISGVHIVKEQKYAALDAEFKYFFNQSMGNTQWFDPYIFTGAGYSWIDTKIRPTINAGLGFNIWLTTEKYKKPEPKHTFKGKTQKKPTMKQWAIKHVGFNFQTMGKVCVNFLYYDNQIQHSFGLVMRL